MHQTAFGCRGDVRASREGEEGEVREEEGRKEGIILNTTLHNPTCAIVQA